MKIITTELDDHLQTEVTTLATLWHLVRSDGEEFHFTDHDTDVVFEGDTYLSALGYSRTAVQNDSSMAVDNLEVMGFLDHELITPEDMRAGLFDYAAVYISLVNWADTSQGTLRMRRGWLGNVTMDDQGTFTAELRGLTQLLSQTIGELYSAECRADLGDHRCKVPVDPPEIERDAAGVPPLFISGTPITDGQVGEVYAGFSVLGIGGVPPYTYFVESGTLPPGIELDTETGDVAGTPTGHGAFNNIVLGVEDAAAQQALLDTFSLTVIPAELTLSGEPVLTATMGVEYEGFQISASGGVPPYIYFVESGTLPTGIEVDADTGDVAGTPTEFGTFSDIVLGVEDALEETAYLDSFTLEVEFVEPMLLDVISSATAAWSIFRKLRDAYSGSAIRVRRSSDNTEQDIGFDGLGYLDVAALETFCGAGDGFVHTIYDQSGNSRHLVQATSGNQAKIVDSGDTILASNGLPTAVSSGSQRYAVASSTAVFNSWHNGADVTSWGVATTDDVAAFRVLYANNGNTGTTTIGHAKRIGAFSGGTLDFIVSQGSGEYGTRNGISATATSGVAFTFVEHADADNGTASLRSTIYFNGGSAINNNTGTAAPSGSNATSDLTLFDAPSTNGPWVGSFQELVMWTGHQNQSDIYNNYVAWT